MVNALNSAVSGMQATTIRQDVTAHNIANVNTDGFGPSHTRQTNIEEQQGTRVSHLSQDPAHAAGFSGTKLEQEMPDQMISETAYGANAAVIRTQDSMMGEILDLKA